MVDKAHYQEVITNEWQDLYGLKVKEGYGMCNNILLSVPLSLHLSLLLVRKQTQVRSTVSSFLLPIFEENQSQ